MRREHRAEAERVVVSVFRGGLAALRILVDHWPAPWVQRRILGERLGVWMLGVAWLTLAGGVAIVLFC